MLDLYEEFGRVIDALDTARIDYAVCGGLAVMIHGHVRATADIDLLLRAEDLEAARTALAGAGFDVAAGPIPFAAGTSRERILHRVSKVDGADFLTVDLMLVTPILEPAWAQRLALRWQARTIRVVSREGLAHMKRLAGRLKDRLDLQELGLEPGDDQDGT